MSAKNISAKSISASQIFTSRKLNSVCDFFETKRRYISDVQIYEREGIKKKPATASIFKSGSPVCEKYIMVRNGKVLGDIDLRTDSEDIFIINLEAHQRQKYKGIGSKLLQIATERSLQKGHNSHVTLNAQKLHPIQRHPEGFYTKMGFEKMPCNEHDLMAYGVPMILNVAESAFWTKRITENPILSVKPSGLENAS